MSTHHEHKIYYAIIETGSGSHLAYQINPSLTIGLDPRNDVVLADAEIEQKHLELKDKDGALILTNKSEYDKTYLNSHLLKKDEQYLITANDKIRIGKIIIKFKKDFGLKSEEVIEKDIHFDRVIHRSENGMNFLQSEEDSLFVDTHHTETIVKKNHRKKNSEPYLIKIEPLNLKIQWDFITKFFLGLIFDFFFSYFILSLVTSLKIHVFLFFSFIEIILMFTFKSTAGQFLFRYKFNRQFSVWILLILFLVFPLSKGSFSKKLKHTEIAKTNIIDIHAPEYKSFSSKNNFNINTIIDSNFYLLPQFYNQKFSLNLFEMNKNENLTINYIESFDSIKLNKFIYRTHPLKLPIKIKSDAIMLKNNFLEIINFDRKQLKKALLTDGPFLTYINDTKTFFIGQLTGNLELVNLPENCPVILLRDEHFARLFFVGTEELYLFSYTRPKNPYLENIFIEKYLAQTSYNLLEKSHNKIGFLEMFDSLPEANFKVLYSIFEQQRGSILDSKNSFKSTFMIESYNQLVDQLLNEVARESRNAGPDFIKQIENLKI